jgi:KaiB domain
LNEKHPAVEAASERRVDSTSPAARSRSFFALVNYPCCAKTYLFFLIKIDNADNAVKKYNLQNEAQVACTLSFFTLPAIRPTPFKHWRTLDQLEIVDVLIEPDRGLSDGIFVAPTLVKLEPKPKKVIFGNLTSTSKVLSEIGWNGTGKGV